MKISKKILVGCLALAVALSSVVFLHASALSTLMTSRQIQQIRDNCVTAKNTLNQLHASDALLRVNIGQTYESISTKMMEKFNKRASNNNYNNDSLVSVTNAYGQTLDVFRSDYIAYEEHLSTALSINCQDQPVSFFDAVALARAERNQVHTDVVRLNQYLDKYQTALNQFEKDYQDAVKGAKQ